MLVFYVCLGAFAVLSLAVWVTWLVIRLRGGAGQRQDRTDVYPMW